MRTVYFLLPCVLWLAGVPSAGSAESGNCAQLDDAQERLACYDAQFPRPKDETLVPPVASPSMTETPAEQTVAPTSPTPATSSSAGTDAGKAAPEKGLFGDEKVDLTSTIKAILAGEKQNMVFQLANDQIWMQATPRPLPFKVGDTVTIKNANLGGYFMRSTKGTSTRVQRIH